MGSRTSCNEEIGKIMQLNKFIFILILIVISIFHEGYAEKNTNAESFENTATNPKLQIALDKVVNYALNKKDKDGGYITAISLLAQCGKSIPTVIVGGTNGINDSTPINENSIFQIGSITKSFISIVILQIAQENNINIDDNTVILKWFPEYPKWGHITLRQLMNMTSGIPGYGYRLDDDIFKKFTLNEYTSKIDPTKILDLTYKLPLHFKPGTRFEYSNTNYTLLGRFIKKVTHNDPEEEVTKRIINKLGLMNTYFPVDREDMIPHINKKQLVHGYAFQPKTSEPYPYMPYGADTLSFSLSDANTGGAMISTPHDINIYLHSIFNADGLFSKYKKQLTTFVSKQTGKPIMFPTKTDKAGFGLGIIGYYWNKSHPIIYAYNGATDGFNFALLVDPKSQVYLVFGINSRADILNNAEDVFSLFTQVEENCRF